MKVRVTRLGLLRAAIQPLINIADAYDANELDDEARKRWGVREECENKTPPEQIELYTGRGGKQLLTLEDCLIAREVCREQDVGELTGPMVSEELLRLLRNLRPEETLCFVFSASSEQVSVERRWKGEPTYQMLGPVEAIDRILGDVLPRSKFRDDRGHEPRELQSNEEET